MIKCYQNARKDSLEEVEIINKRKVEYYSVKFPNGAVWKMKKENGKHYKYGSLGHYSEWGFEEVKDKRYIPKRYKND